MSQDAKHKANQAAGKHKYDLKKSTLIKITDKVKDTAQMAKEKAKKYTDKAGQKIERAGEDIQRKV